MLLPKHTRPDSAPPPATAATADSPAAPAAPATKQKRLRKKKIAAQLRQLAKSVDELRSRLELAEKRLAVLEYTPKVPWTFPAPLPAYPTPQIAPWPTPGPCRPDFVWC